MIAIVLLVVLGLGAMIGGGIGLGAELTREPTGKEIRAAGKKEGLQRWRFLSAAEIFPATVPYWTTNVRRDPERLARRVGITPETPCAEAFDTKAAAIMVKHGCRTVLRATYLDASGTLVATVGVAVLADVDQASGARGDYSAGIGVHQWSMIGLRAVGFPGTPAERFNDARRQEFKAETNDAPYVYFRTSGWTDQRTGVPEDERAEDFTFSDGVMDHLYKRFAPSAEPCKLRGVAC